MCSHRPPCPPAARRDRDAARTVARHPEQGWFKALRDKGSEVDLRALRGLIKAMSS